ncbi:MAG: hypothetical protein ABI165_10865 [Bryobacteraceae bacterium]
MIFRWRRSGRAARSQRDGLGGLFRRLGEVPYYGSPERRRQLGAGSLDAMAPVTLDEYLGQRGQFAGPMSRATQHTFEYPVDPVPRIAVLHRGFRSSGGVRAFPDGWSDEVSAFAPEAIAATAAELSRLAIASRSGRVALPSLRSASVALIELGEPWPDETESDLWWDTFGVPVFNYLLGPSGELLAMECEARDGLHVVDGRVIVEEQDGELLITPLAASIARLRTGWSCRVEEPLCGCGRRGVKLAQLAGMAPSELAVAAGR